MTLYKLRLKRTTVHSTDTALLERLCIALGLKKTAVTLSEYDGDLQIALKTKAERKIA